MPHRFYIPWVPKPRTMKRISRIHIWIYQKTRGLLGARLDGLDMLLLTTTGRRSGQPRTQPLPYFMDGHRYLVVASFGGGDRDPDWFYNVEASPEVRLRVGRLRIAGTARRAEGEERERLWRDITYEHPRYLVYQEKTERRIPIVVIEPSPPAMLRAPADTAAGATG